MRLRLADLDPVALADLVRRDGRAAAVDGEVAVDDELARLGAAGGEAHPEDDVVEARLEQAQQVLAGHAGTMLGGLEVALELALVDQ